MKVELIDDELIDCTVTKLSLRAGDTLVVHVPGYSQVMSTIEGRRRSELFKRRFIDAVPAGVKVLIVDAEEKLTVLSGA